MSLQLTGFLRSRLPATRCLFSSFLRHQRKPKKLKNITRRTLLLFFALPVRLSKPKHGSLKEPSGASRGNLCASEERNGRLPRSPPFFDLANAFENSPKVKTSVAEGFSLLVGRCTMPSCQRKRQTESG